MYFDNLQKAVVLMTFKIID